MATNAQNTVQEISKLEQKLAELKQQRDTEATQRLANLPAETGISGVELVKRLAEVLKVNLSDLMPEAPVRRRGRRPGAGAAKKSAGRSGPRGKMDDEKQKQLKKMVEEGKTGNEIAKALGISLPSVANWKKKLSLSKPRK